MSQKQILLANKQKRSVKLIFGKLDEKILNIEYLKADFILCLNLAQITNKYLIFFPSFLTSLPMTINPTTPMSSLPPAKPSAPGSKIIYGYILALCAHCCVAISQFFIKRARANLPVSQSLYLVFIQCMVYNYLLMQHKGLSSVFTKPNLNRLVILRGFLGLTGATALTISLGKLLLSEVIIIGNTAPLITSILAILFLKERFDVALGLNAILSVIGVLLIAKPAFLFASSSTEEQPKSEIVGLIAACVSAIVGGIVPLVIKYLGSRTHPITLVYFYGLVTSIMSAIFMTNEGVKTVSLYYMVMLFIGGVMWAFGQMLTSVSFMYADASRLSMVLYSQVVFAYALEILVDGIYPDSSSVIGTVFIMSGFLVMLRKAFQHARAQKESELLQKKLCTEQQQNA